MKLTQTFAAAAAVAGMTLGASGEINANSYIRRGLIAQWDGVDNLATGTHVADTNVWVDRMGNSTDFTASYLSFTDGMCASLDGKVITSTCSKLPTKYAESTIEIHAFATRYTGHKSTDDLLGSGQCSKIYWQNCASTLGCAYVGNGTQAYFAGKNFVFNPAQGLNITDVTNTWSLTTGDFGFSLYANGVLGTTKTPSYYTEDYSINQSINFGSGNVNTTYKAFSIRVYDRRLSQEEIMLNAAFDKVRFHGASWEDSLPANLPDGYRLNAAGDDFEVRVTVNVADASGVLSVNGAEGSASNEIWVARGTPIEVTYQGAGQSSCRWIGAPDWATSPKEGQIAFAAHDPISIDVVCKVVNPVPVVDFSALTAVGGDTLKIAYNVTSAGELADTVSLLVCYGQDPSRLAYTNVTDGVISEGEVLVSGVIPSRTYYVKLVADGNGRTAETEVKSATMGAGSYATYAADQPLVTAYRFTAMQEALRIRGDVIAPAGTRLVVHYGTSQNMDEMTALDFGTEGIRDGGYFADLANLVAGTEYYFVIEMSNGGFCDYYPVQNAAPCVKSAPSAVRMAASFDGKDYLATSEIMSGVFNGAFTMSVWVKKPMGITAGEVDQWGLARQGCIMGCGTAGSGVPGPMISVSPLDWSPETDAEFAADPKYVLSAGIRAERNKNVQECFAHAPVELEIWKDDTWHHVAMTYDPNIKTVKLYLDAALVATNRNESLFEISDPAYAMTFGANERLTGYGRLIGQLAEATVWRVAMDAKGIRQLMRGKFTDDDRNLAGHWLAGREPYLADFTNHTKHPYDLVNKKAVTFVKARDLRIGGAGLVLILK